jgi:hypothetical protein
LDGWKGYETFISKFTSIRDVKEILVMCWTFKNEHRPGFTYLSNSLETISRRSFSVVQHHVLKHATGEWMDGLATALNVIFTSVSQSPLLGAQTSQIAEICTWSPNKDLSSPHCCFRAIKQKQQQIKSFDVLTTTLSTTITYHFTKTWCH